MTSGTLNPLKDILHTHSNELWDVAALVRAATDRALASPHDDNQLVRLLMLAGAKIDELQEIIVTHI